MLFRSVGHANCSAHVLGFIFPSVDPPLQSHKHDHQTDLHARPPTQARTHMRLHSPFTQQSLITSMLNVDPSKRVTAEQILAGEWIHAFAGRKAKLSLGKMRERSGSGW